MILFLPQELWAQSNHVQIVGDYRYAYHSGETLAEAKNIAYAEAVRRYAPYNRLVQPLPQMRKEALALIQQAVAEHRPIYVLVNNRAEGNAPLTIQALADALLLPDPAAEPAAAG